MYSRFTVSGGTVSVSCPSAMPCLDREQTSAYDLIVVAIDKGILIANSNSYI